MTSSARCSEREITDRGDIEARAAELGADLGDGAGVLIGRAVPHVAQTGEWRARVLIARAPRDSRGQPRGARGGRRRRARRAPRWSASSPPTDEERLAARRARSHGSSSTS